MYIRDSKINTDEKEIKGDIVQFENETYYKISNFDAMRPFFMSIVSHSNHWMFVSSNGGLTAGRKNSNFSLFPYYTDDKITESAHITGSKTICRIENGDKTFLWEPLATDPSGIYKISRNLYKSANGDKLVFEEINEDFNLTFRYHWNTSEKFGFVKKSELHNNSDSEVIITVLDGIENILPYGVDPALQNASSNLVDAYKKNELEVESGLGIYTLSAIPVDKAEPSEALKCNTVWSVGLENTTHLISSQQLDNFKKGQSVKQEIDVRAEKGAYFITSRVELKAKETKQWMLVGEVDQSMVEVVAIQNILGNSKNLQEQIQESINQDAKKLFKLNAGADACQLTADELRDTRHFSNSLFNIMRGGIFDHNYRLEKDDFMAYINNANTSVFENHKGMLQNLPDEFSLFELRKKIGLDSDSDLKRLVLEYLPLKFSRRHGDPSRPWNRFSINTVSEEGKKVLDYEGNWRDIFQNWEALAHSYPAFIENMIHKFLNATTFDGYNPYRVTKDGFDWEVIEPDNPWSYIGYWGDHQIIYLLKFLEFIENHYPNRLASYFHEDIFVYANVPYKIKDYKSILKNPKDTIEFDEELNAAIEEERKSLGADAALLKVKGEGIYKVNLLEKLLATVLSKISNYIPEAGIWMNTQRPEWNDANNALVGNGVSMVTLCYLRRFLFFFKGILERINEDKFQISQELITCFSAIAQTLENHIELLDSDISNSNRKVVMDGLGEAGSDYRTTIYKQGFSGKTGTLTKQELLNFTKNTLRHVDKTIDVNRRKDNLYHSYNLMTVENDTEVSISHLSKMLEGQVAVLSSGYISSETSLKVLDALKQSDLFREDQYSYMLYPNKKLPRFVDKNNIPPKPMENSKLIQNLLESGNLSIVQKDANGGYHFNGKFNNAKSLAAALEALPNNFKDSVKREKADLLAAFEKTFDHKSFTGRSGTFYGYEGLGSIYWHMVSKLLLAVEETCLVAFRNNSSKEIQGRLLEHFYEINEGIGVHKSPELYGAFPTDAYSHTPEGKGAQQPGMTGQVKEDILSRFGELGVFVKGGKLFFEPYLLRSEELLQERQTFRYVDVNSDIKEIALDKDSLAFTYCQVPMIYKKGNKNRIEVTAENDSVTFDALTLNEKLSNEIFNRTGYVKQVIISVKHLR